jgi:NADPH:quinone reductase
VILEMLANINLGQDLKTLAYRGRVVVVGCRGTVEINPREIMSREAAVFGILLWRVPEDEASEIYAAVEAGLGSRTLSLVIASEVPLASPPKAHHRIMEGGARGKIVLPLSS